MPHCLLHIKYINCTTNQFIIAYLLVKEYNTIVTGELLLYSINKRKRVSMQEDNTVQIPAVMRTLDVLENLFTSARPKSLAELSKELKIPQASLFRILKSMAIRDYISVIEEVPYKYVVGYKAIQLVTDYRKKFNNIDIIKPVMENLTYKTHQTAQYAVFQNNIFYYIEQVLSTAELNFIAQLYKPLEINTSAGAKIILANLPLEVQNSYLAGATLHRKTPNTITDMDELKKDLQRSYLRGYALDNEEFAMGIGCMFVPIFNKRNECVGAIGVTGYIKEYNEKERFSYIYSCLNEAAQVIGGKLLI